MLKSDTKKVENNLFKNKNNSKIFKALKNKEIKTSM